MVKRKPYFFTMAKKIIFLVPSFFLAVFLAFSAILFSDVEVCNKNKTATVYDTISPYTIIAPTTSISTGTSSTSKNASSTDNTASNASSTSSTSQVIVEPTPSTSTTTAQSEGSAVFSSQKEASGVFLHPTSGSVLSGTIEVSFYSEEAQGVEFYVQRKEDAAHVYLGKGVRKSDFTWYFLWPTEKFPNGNYVLYAKTFDASGSYNAEEISIGISNAVTNQTQVQTTTQSQTSLTPASESQATISPKLIQQIETTTKQDITNSVKSLASEAEKFTADLKKKEQIKKEFDSLSQKITNNLNAAGSGEVQKSKDEINQNTNDLLNFINEMAGGDREADKLEIKIRENVEEAIGKVEKVVAEKEEAYSPAVLDQKESPDYKVEKVEMVASSVSDEKTLKIEGTAPPFSYVTIYIYSIPTIVIARADENGKWEYNIG